ncbi:efflux RND transporter permease subunit [Bacillus benzoevorans]|uniref:HAE1 family hydrophobic/amphiphilic exporter-1 n=1 Tax=Bacillus benzoevorans TaxID=1456 RepID=A0A7X0LUZ6_9BACI|nr:efflux RND transporter permease subunit [Bacillus benzoevorans]MBB6444985.1 HAE1 family hydrophobic/amphiphilic exporter-1 [Bacillus benzoevorans]
MKKVIQFSLKNKFAIWILTIILTATGIYSGMTMKLETIPSITAPLVSVTTVYPGATPEEVMEHVTIPIEQQVQNLDGVSTVISTSFQNASSVQIEYDYSKDMEKAQNEVKEALAGLIFPETVKDPEISRLNLNEYPVMSLSASDDKKSLAELTTLVDEMIVPQMKGLDGVASVQVSGNEVQEVKLTFIKEKLIQYGLNEETVRNVIKGSNVTLPLGLHTFADEEKSVVVDGNITTIDDLKTLKIPVVSQGAGQMQGAQRAPADGAVQLPHGIPTVELQEIASIEMASKAESISRTNGKWSIGVQIVKAADANTVDVVNSVKEKAEKLEKAYAGLNMTTVMDQGKPIEDSVQTMLSKAIFGALFAMLIILIFLRNFKTTIISVISIPLSLLIAITILHQMGITLNIMTLGAMTVAIGRVIDDSIVVIENIFRRMSKEDEDLKGKGLIVEAAKEMFIPISSSTIVTIAVFLPLGFVKGPIGELFLPFALTVVFSLLASLVISITVVPMMAHSFFKNGLHQEREMMELGHKERRGSRGKGFHFIVIDGIKHHRILLSAAAVLLLIGSAFVPTELTAVLSVIVSILLVLVIVSIAVPSVSHKESERESNTKQDVPPVKESIPDIEHVHHEQRPGFLAEGYQKVLKWSLNHKVITTSLAVLLLAGSLFLIPMIGVSFIASEKDKMVYAVYSPEPGQTREEVVKIADQAEKIFQSRAGVKTIQFSLGSENPMNPGQSNNAIFYVEYEQDTENFAEESEAVMKELQKKAPRGEWSSMNMASTGSGSTLSMLIFGDSIADIQPVVQRLEQIFKDNKDLTNVATTLSKTYEEYTLVADQDKLSRLGLTAAQIGMELSQQENRAVLTTVEHKGNKLNVYLEKEEGYSNVEDLTAKTIPSPLGIAVPIKEVTEVIEGTTSNTLTRRDNRIYASVSGEIKTKDVAAVSAAVQKNADMLKLPQHVEVSMGGVTEQMTDSFMQLGLAICAAIAIVYFVLVVTFGGGLAPFAILFSLPFAVIGGLVGLLASHETISVSAMIGFLMLIGIVVTNAIVLIDRVILKENEGLSTRDALLEAAGTRLRPILMTAIATIGALLPLAFGMEGSGLISKGLGVTVIGGLISSTLLTLLIVPIVYETLMKAFRKNKHHEA